MRRALLVLSATLALVAALACRGGAECGLSRCSSSQVCVHVRLRGAGSEVAAECASLPAGCAGCDCAASTADGWARSTHPACARVASRPTCLSSSPPLNVALTCDRWP